MRINWEYLCDEAKVHCSDATAKLEGLLCGSIHMKREGIPPQNQVTRNLEYSIRVQDRCYLHFGQYSQKP